MVKMISESIPKRWKSFLSSSQWVTRTYFPRAHMSHALDIIKKNSAALFATSLNKTWWFVGFNSLTAAAAAASSPCWLGVGQTGASTGCPFLVVNGRKEEGRRKQRREGVKGETNEGTWKDEDGQKREKAGLVTQLLSNRSNNLTAAWVMQHDLLVFTRQYNK